MVLDKAARTWVVHQIGSPALFFISIQSCIQPLTG